MNSWKQNFLFHPVFNRFNNLFLFAWLMVGIWPGAPDVLLPGLVIEAIYLGARFMLDRSPNSFFKLRRLPSPSRRRFIAVAEKAAQTERDFKAADAKSQLLNSSLIHAKRLVKVFADLLLMEQQFLDYLESLLKSLNSGQDKDLVSQFENAINLHVRRALGQNDIDAIREAFQRKIMDYAQQKDQAEGEMATLAENNLEIYRKRKASFEQVVQNLEVVRVRLQTIENTLSLLADTALGLRTPEDVSLRAEVLMTNMQDAETFLAEVREIENKIQASKVH